MHVETFYDLNTSTFTHIVVDESTKKCAVIDSVLDYESNAAKVTTESADKVIAYIKDNNLENSTKRVGIPYSKIRVLHIPTNKCVFPLPT